MASQRCLSRRSARFLTRLYERYLEPAGLTSSQFSILSLLEHRPLMTVAEVADGMEMERTTLVRALKPLKEAGLVVEGDEKLGRAVKLNISSLGTKKLNVGRPYWEAAQRAFEVAVGKENAARLRQMTLAVTAQNKQ